MKASILVVTLMTLSCGVNADPELVGRWRYVNPETDPLWVVERVFDERGRAELDNTVPHGNLFAGTYSVREGRIVMLFPQRGDRGEECLYEVRFDRTELVLKCGDVGTDMAHIPDRYRQVYRRVTAE